MELVKTRAPEVPVTRATLAVGLSRATFYRRVCPPSLSDTAALKRPSHRKLDPAERQEVLDVLGSEPFMDQPPVEVHAALLKEGRYLCSVRTMQRILKEEAMNQERRLQRKPRTYAAPRLVARAPNQVWTWDITKLPTLVKTVFLNLYMVMDLYSRFVVGWMVALRENSAHAKHLMAWAIRRYQIAPGELTLHQDRGAPMTALGFADLLNSLGVEKSHSRPRVSNDNAHAESHFKTLKFQPDYPGVFQNPAHARAWNGDFFDWYNHRHAHSGLLGLCPADVFFGKATALLEARQRVMDQAFAQHPERFVKGPHRVGALPAEVWINQLVPEPALPTLLPVGNEVLSLTPQAFILQKETAAK